MSPSFIDCHNVRDVSVSKASIVAAYSTHPLKLIKVRMQLQGKNYASKPNPVVYSFRLAHALHPGSIPPMPQAAVAAATVPNRMGPISVGVCLI